MLQQTRVAAVIEHYQEFLRRFPTVQKLAAAQENAVLAAWSGLGYYRRARMMHAAAKIIAKEFQGEFPASAAGLRALPGIGRYTAAAIASIAFAEPVAVVDGNVERVLQRCLGKRLAATEMWQIADDWLDRNRPGDFNQAMMELGATVCTPRSPSCLACPLLSVCVVRGEMPSGAKSARQKKRELHYALDCRDGAVFLVQRAENARLMAGMWELPELHGAPDSLTTELTLRHSITVTDYTVRVRRSASYEIARGEWVALENLRNIALTGLARKILHRAELMPGSSSIDRLK